MSCSRSPRVRGNAGQTTVADDVLPHETNTLEMSHHYSAVDPQHSEREKKKELLSCLLEVTQSWRYSTLSYLACVYV
ncbi:hypothetical protein E2C01_025306 [Portunus trituberculatus]|uniref:Uncharacterized protein n=1 Tax=Portunus trituberculatus TaxID=210409 RepID=A0A5B7EG48_PORTR|nr:hypothetical protein [Portunus trituberculatus]